jgi:NTP pyrophosphatase (non-canonical NTP hydrolase)
MMNFDEYQQWAKTTAIYPEQVKGLYPLLGLLGEATETIEKATEQVAIIGENEFTIQEDAYKRRQRLKEIFNIVLPLGKEAEVIKKHYRKYGLGFSAACTLTGKPEQIEELKKELGDILWYLSAICSDFGISLQDVAQTNHDKLESRRERNVLNGSGDNR